MYADTLKYFGCELGAQTKFDKDTGVSIVNGSHDAKKLADILETFIKKYVQCYKCGNPETVIKIRKECIHLKCKACGNTSDVDMRDKLTTFIIKNPPENKLSKAEAKVKHDTKERLKDAEKDIRKIEKADSKKKRKYVARVGCHFTSFVPLSFCTTRLSHSCSESGPLSFGTCDTDGRVPGCSR